MIRKAVGTVISSTMVTATTNRTIGRLFARRSTMVGPRMATTATSAISVATSTGTTVKTTLPGKVSLDQERPMTVMLGSLVDAAHDRVQAGHDGHRVRDEMAGHHQADGLQVDERR